MLKSLHLKYDNLSKDNECFIPLLTSTASREGAAFKSQVVLEIAEL